MAATSRWSYRHPKTTQELRNNQDRNDLLVRGNRRKKNLPNDRDDKPCGHLIRSWKKKRKKQYRENKIGYCWRSFKFYDQNCYYPILGGFQTEKRIRQECDRLGFYHRQKDGIFYWYGTDLE